MLNLWLDSSPQGYAGMVFRGNVCCFLQCVLGLSAAVDVRTIPLLLVCYRVAECGFLGGRSEVASSL